MPVMVALKVYEYYPKMVAVIPIEDDFLGKFSCALYKLDEDGRHYTDVLYELGHYNHTQEIEAVKEMVRTVEDAMKVVKVMAN